MIQKFITFASEFRETVKKRRHSEEKIHRENKKEGRMKETTDQNMH